MIWFLTRSLKRLSLHGTISRDSREKYAENISRRTIQALAKDSMLDPRKAGQVLTLWFLCLYDVLRLSEQEWRSLIGRIPSQFNGQTWSTFVQSLKFADETLLYVLTRDFTFESVSTFKQWLGFSAMDAETETALLPPLLVKLMFQCIKNHDVHLFKGLHQIFCFPTRPDVLTDAGTGALEDKCAARFVKTESRIANLPVVPEERGASFFKKYLGDYDPYADFIGHFSNGAAIVGGANSKYWFDKWRSLRTTSRMEYLRWATGYEIGQFPPAIHPTMAKFLPVPKDATKARGITVEPAMNAYLQQGFMRSLRQYIRNHPYLSRRISFEHPERNEQLAKLGSIDGSMSTIDLSDASDSIRWEQLEFDCSGLPLIEAVAMCRSSEVEFPDGSRMRLKKLGGMGNALTFTLECLTFCKIVEQGIMDAHGSVQKSKYRVYGDDIVVETIYYPYVIKALEREGYVVNTTKSFDSVAFKFRESCGGEYVDGISVKPIRLPRGKWATASRIPSSYSRWVQNRIDIANSCYGELPSVRLYLIHQILTYLPKRLYPVFTSDGSTGLISDQPTNYHLVRKPVTYGPLRELHYQTAIVHGTLDVKKHHRMIDEDTVYRYRLNQLALAADSENYQLDPLRPDPIDLRSVSRGMRWKSITEPDYYSG